MEILFDTANLSDIAAMTPVYPVDGVTTNPTILKAEGRIDLYPHLRRIREIIGFDRTLHVQVLAQDAAGIVADAHRLLDQIDDQIYVKVPTTEPGIQAMRLLHEEGIHVTATAVYSTIQGILAVAAGADYVAPYVNRMESLGIDTAAMLKALAAFIERDGADCKILAASFKNAAQISAAFEAGATAVTVSPMLLRTPLSAPDVREAVNGFAADWYSAFGSNSLP